MIDHALKYLPVYLGSMFKFIFGPTLGIGIGLTIVETVILTILGMMTTVVCFAFLGDVIREKVFKKYFPNRKIFTKRNRIMVKISKNMGIAGISFLTPVLFSPIIGTILSTYIGGTATKIIFWMFFSAVFWSVVITSCFSYLIESDIQVLNIFSK